MMIAKAYHKVQNLEGIRRDYEIKFKIQLNHFQQMLQKLFVLSKIIKLLLVAL